MLLQQPEPKAGSLTLKPELFTDGFLVTVTHETNADMLNRIIYYNIFGLGKHHKTIGLLVITDAMIIRTYGNWRKE